MTRLCYLPKSWLRDSWNLAATVGVLGFMVMNWPLGLCITRAVSLRLCKSKNILEINLSLELMSSAITSYLKIKTMVFCYHNCSDLLWEKIVLVIKKFEAEGGEFAKILRSLEQFIQTVKGQNNFCITECFLNLLLEVSNF